MFYRPALIPVFSGPALEVVSELGGQARLPCSLSSPKVHFEKNHFISYLAFTLQSGDRPKLVLWFREEDPAKPIYTVDLRGFNFDNI